MSGRLDRALKDRQLLAQFLAVLILIVGVINFIPAVYHWNLWATQSNNPILPAWIYIELLIAATLGLYGLFLLQVRHWTTLKVIAVVSLILACCYAFATTSIVLGGTGAQFSNLLGISYNISKTAVVWCTAMLLICLVVSLLAVKEAFNWQRIEQIVQEIGQVEPPADRSELPEQQSGSQ